MDATRELAELSERLVELGVRFFHESFRRGGVLSETRLDETQLDGQGDESLLGAVVQIALEPSAFGVACLDDSDA